MRAAAARRPLRRAAGTPPRALRVLALAALAAGLAASGAPGAGVTTARVASARTAAPRAVAVSCPSPALERKLPVAVYLPPGYTATGPRLPVVYFLHGLPASPASYRAAGFVARALEQAGRAAIVAVPQGAAPDEPDSEYLDLGPGREWETAISRDLTRCIDGRFHTIADRQGRALVGVSAGGYGAAHIGLNHLGTFAVVESWSGYFHPTDPSGLQRLDLGSPEANTTARVRRGPGLRSEVGREPTLFAFYVGSGDARFRAANLQLHAALQAQGVPHVFRLYPGGHDQTLWTSHAVEWLGMAIDHLAPTAA